MGVAGVGLGVQVQGWGFRVDEENSSECMVL